ncbi:DUF6912 family protein [Thermasporomyces composti]|jgi:hypothetical protein|uniref:Uncharacterized protein n=1 Tax=Thermasporomyces composti TaxID=696763 RepID=A0A3D9VH89_THECX|nr:hypothetical protein [Thermasporomyces composti]REF37554.1 hypothetical protein DFJ64_2998 [Thermasporomyces composti]
MRVYLGVTMTELAAAVAHGGFGPPPLTAHAVTPALREWLVDGDQEELEYAATEGAAHTSLQKVSADPRAPRRRVVVAADVPDAMVRPVAGQTRSTVEVQTAVRLSDVASVHVDEPAATEAVEAAVAALARASEDDTVTDELAERELLWYARQEIPDLLAEVTT